MSLQAVFSLYLLLNKVHRWTFAARKDPRTTLSFSLREFRSENGNEFVNQAVTDWHRNPV
jgi:hypothetical protein